MNPIEKEVMTGMISILNQAIESKQNGNLIMSDEDFDIRLKDLKEFEDEIGFMFANSPNCKLDLESIVNIKAINSDNLKECKNVSEISEYSNQKEIFIYLDIVGTDMIITYVDGYLANIQSNYSNAKGMIKHLNLPYKIEKDGVYTIKGKVAPVDNPIFYVNNVIEGGCGNLRDDLNEAKNLNFDIVRFWFANSLNPKKLKDTIDYVIDNYVKDIEDDLEYDGIVFKFNEKKNSNVLSFEGCYYEC